ncbi:hypothetical protein ABZ769_06385 [Streptomyces olivoreticuli]
MAHTPQPAPYAARKGELVWDSALDRVGEVTDDRYRLRPPGGGAEWHAEPRSVRPATRAEALRARVAVANAESRKGRK